MAVARTILALGVWLAAPAAPVLAQEHETPAPPTNKWSFAGPFGKYDRAQLQRGLKVYREVCQVCHGLKLVAFRTLADPGGPGFTIPQATAIAAECGSAGSWPAMIESASAASSTERQRTPTWSRLHASGVTPRALMRPWVGLKPTTPQ